MEKKDISLVKLGGSLITNKKLGSYAQRALDEDAIQEVIELIFAHKGGPMILAHGNGSYGHPVASAHKKRLEGSPWDNEAALAIRSATRELNEEIYQRLVTAGLHIKRFFTEDVLHQTSSALEFNAGILEQLLQLLDSGSIPLLYGAMINAPGGYEVLSTEALLAELGVQLNSRIKQALFFSDEPGIYDELKSVIPKLQVSELSDVQKRIIRDLPEGTADVSGGMRHKLAMAGKLASNNVPTFIGRPSEGAFHGKVGVGTWVVA